MIANVAKWGNSLAMRIPREAARQLGIEEGRAVDIAVEDGALVLRPVTEQTVYDLDELVARIHPGNLHDEVPTGVAIGNEA